MEHPLKEVFDIPKIDSLRIHLPIEHCTIVDDHFLREHLVVCDGEVVDQHIKTTKYNEVNGVGVGYKKVQLRNGKESREYISIGFSSKLLKKDYLQGISKHNIQTIYNYILQDGVIEVDYENFINARAVDIDICKDVLLEGTTCKDVISVCKQLSVAHKETVANAFTKQDNTGIEWGKRDKVFKAYKKKQYLKYYAKLVELTYKSKEFKDAYLDIPKEVNLENWLRVETTIKNSEHFKTYDIHCKTLTQLLDIDFSKHLDIFNRPIKWYMTGKKEIKKREGISITDRVVLKELKRYILEFGDYEAIDCMVRDYSLLDECKMAKSRFRKKLKDLLPVLQDQNIDDKKQMSFVYLKGVNLIP